LDRFLWALVVFFCLVSVVGYPQSCPTVCVIVPEEDRCIVPRPVPDPACETAIIRAFLSYGFHVVDRLLAYLHKYVGYIEEGGA